ncbi:hypothetical protein EBZ38_03620 [bacterium]|nr:hypothetical protein [bacterium]NBX98455.1 hypothetical protein [bacterium]NDC94103.1 hypothetical protein [bacterium]NDD83356.1 hypothetical protein [bacterium]
MITEKSGMTKFLSDVLSVERSVFTDRIAKLEQATRAQGIDIALTMQIKQETNEKLLSLGLDPSDTTAAELYSALQVKALADNKRLLKTIGLTVNASSVDIMQALVVYANKRLKVNCTIAIKSRALKKILTDAVPLRTMKVLRYRSAASMLKREHPNELYVLAQLLESDSYKKRLQNALRQLKPSDYEETSIQLYYLDKTRWEHVRTVIKKNVVPIFAVPEVGTIVVLPILTSKTPCLALMSLALLFKELRLIKQASMYVKLRMLDPSFHQHLEMLHLANNLEIFKLVDIQVYWHHIHTLIGDGRAHYEFSPHITKSDTQWSHIESEMSSLDKELKFWEGTHRLAFMQGDQLVSLHVIDVCFSVMYKTPIHAAPKRFVQNNISDELIYAYLSAPPYSSIVQDELIKIADAQDNFVYYEA